MKVILATSPHLNHASFQEGVVPLGADRLKIAQTFAPMGLMSLAGSAHDVAAVEIRDINKAINSRHLPMSPRFYEATAEWLLESEPDVVGFMSEADSYHHLLRICSAIKSRLPSVDTLFGGPHASAVHRETLERFPAVDFVIRGEGESAFPAFLEGLRHHDVSHVGNLTYRSSGTVKENRMLPLIANLDDLPWPDYSIIDLQPDDAVFIEVGRGCPMQCNFCFTAPYWQRIHRIKGPERLIAEFTELQMNYGLTDFNLTHDLFTTSRSWVLEFCRELEASSLSITWTCSSRTDRLDEELIQAMASVGCRNIYFGLESGTPAMQTSIEKYLDLDWAYEIVGKAVEGGIGATVGFIAGLTGESKTSLHGTLRQGFRYLRLEDSIVHLFGFNPYRGSSVYEFIEKDLTFDPHFVDFPLGNQSHEENCELMREHLDLFSRYTWLSHYDDLDLGTLRAAEEFFPIINAIRPLALALADRGVDPLTLLVAWSNWIFERNQTSGQSGSGVYRGTIEEFLQFSLLFASDQELTDPMLTEMVHWEKLKNVIRAPAEVAGAESSAARTHSDLVTNSTIIIEEFIYAPSFSRGSTPSAATYAFYTHTDGSPAIVRLRSLAVLLLELAQDGVPEETLVSALTANSSGTANATRLTHQVLRGLKEQELLLHRASLMPENVDRGVLSSSA